MSDLKTWTETAKKLAATPRANRNAKWAEAARDALLEAIELAGKPASKPAAKPGLVASVAGKVGKKKKSS